MVDDHLSIVLVLSSFVFVRDRTESIKGSSFFTFTPGKRHHLSGNLTSCMNLGHTDYWRDLKCLLAVKVPLSLSLPAKHFNSASGYKNLLPGNPFLYFFFASSSLFFFPSTLAPHHERLTLYTTTMNAG
jgi:hypothetical protein